MRQRQMLDLTLGFFVAGGFLLLVLFIVLIGKERGLFERTAIIKAQFVNVGGLSVGAQVLIGGVSVGYVSKIIFPRLEANDAKQALMVEMKIARQMMPWLREDSIARIDSKGLLGEKNINITIGSVSSKQVMDGGVLRSEMAFDITTSLAKAQGILDNVNESVLAVRKVMDSFMQEGGDKAIADAVKSLKNITREVEQGDGVVHRLIYDKESGKKYTSIMAGVDETVHSLNASIKGIESLIKEIKTGKGLAHNLIYGTDDGSIVSNLEQASEDLKVIMENLRKGEGTVGKLLMDPSIYESLKTILGRVERNTALKNLVRFSISKNAQ